MTNPINITNQVQSLASSRSLLKTPGQAPVEGKDFKSILLDSLNEVNRLQTEADAGVQKLLTGETNNVAEVLAAANKAGVAFDLLMEVRNKLSDAYDEIKQMRV